jgi:hypothetical protein
MTLISQLTYISTMETIIEIFSAQMDRLSWLYDANLKYK